MCKLKLNICEKNPNQLLVFFGINMIKESCGLLKSKWERGGKIIYNNAIKH